MEKFLFVLSILCFTMCRPNPEINDAIVVDLKKVEKASLFDYFDSIELIPLETSSDVLIVAISKMQYYNKKYYMLDPVQSTIFVFDNEGNFVSKIDKKGQGDGEYTFIQDFIINPFTDNIEILEPTGIVRDFDIKGNYIGKKQINYPNFRSVHSIAAINSNTHVFYSMFQPNKIIYYNLVEEKLLHEEFEESYRLGSFSNIPYQYQNDWFFFRPIDLEVYKLETKGLEVVFRFDFGLDSRKGSDIIFSKESERNYNSSIKAIFEQSPYIIHSVRHNNKYVIVSISINDINNRSNIIYDRVSNKSKLIDTFTENVLFNSYRMEEIIVTDEYVLMPIQWVELEKRVKKEMLNDQQKNTFEKLINSEMEENPILIKYWFK